jgi:hypothetical protein
VGKAENIGHQEHEENQQAGADDHPQRVPPGRQLRDGVGNP